MASPMFCAPPVIRATWSAMPNCANGSNGMAISFVRAG
jgi:hypothetical protein